MTYRDYVRYALGDRTKVLVALDLALGSPADRPLDGWDAMFAPSALRAGVAAAFGAKPERLHAGPHARRVATGWTGRGAVAAVAALVFLVAFLGTWRGGWWSAVVLACTGTGLALVALVPLALSVRSSLPVAWPNLVVFAWLPTDIAIAILAVYARADRPRVCRALSAYLLARAAILVLLLAGALTGLVVQPLAPAVAVPLAVMVGSLLGLSMSRRPWRMPQLSETTAPAPVPNAVRRRRNRPTRRGAARRRARGHRRR